MDFRSWILAPGYSYLQTSNSNILFKYSNAKHLIVKCRSKKGKKEQTCSFDLDFFTNRPEMFHNSTTSTNRSIVLCQLHQRKKRKIIPLHSVTFIRQTQNTKKGKGIQHVYYYFVFAEFFYWLASLFQHASASCRESKPRRDCS